MKRRHLILVLAATLTGATALAKELVKTDVFRKELTISAAGSVLVNNLNGSVEVTGTDEAKVLLVSEKTVRGVDQDAIEEGRQMTELRMAGDEKGYRFTTIVPAFHGPRWSSSVKYTVRVPRTIDVTVMSVSGERIHISDIRGNVTISTLHAPVLVQGLTGSSLIDSANGNITFMAPPRGMANAHLRTVNGNIDFHAPADANFQWVGESVKGDVRTTFPARIRSVGNNAFEGNVNAGGGPTLTTSTLMGNILVMKNGTQLAAARPVRVTEPNILSARNPMSTQGTDLGVVQGQFMYAASLGDIRIKEIRGSARVSTGAGEVNLGSVFGNCQVTSLGGPLNLGEILGLLTARTDAGDILVQAANRGGSLETGGGIIRLLYTNGATRLISGGGDIVVRQAAAPINAETRSGDITITMDPASKSEKISAKTLKGNIILNVTPAFAGDIDATVITSSPDTNRFRSDFPKLSIQRDQYGGKTRFRITGKVNGGGEKVELFAEDGGIQITANNANPITVIAPR
jgi:DUF4097 and DUF4098 domain-containing protein YvlB